MIRHGDDGSVLRGMPRGSLLSEYDGLRRIARSDHPVPFGTVADFDGVVGTACRIRYVSDYDGGAPVYSYFDNAVEEAVPSGRLSGRIELEAEFNAEAAVDGLMLDFGGSSIPALDITLKALAYDGASYIDLGTVRAGFPSPSAERSVCWFASYGVARNQYGIGGIAICRFSNESASSRRYRILVDPVSTSSGNLMLKRVFLFHPESFLSPVASFAFEDGYSDSFYGESPSRHGVSVSNGRLLFNGSDSHLVFASTFLFWLETAAMSFWLKTPSPTADGIVLSFGRMSLELLEEESSSGTRYAVSLDGVHAPCPDLSDRWHRVAIEFTASRRMLYIDGEQTASARAPSPFSDASSSLVFGSDSSNGVAGMEVRQLRFYDHLIGREGVLDEMTRLA